ncbi:DUF5723 family protein [Labilibacter marinus]|uniref:DUF5723 family protein n=1 Tax=Labilibacter marinus TaxID=1477105 RepID=UPI0009502161|nr:DUF5723 family protein [Labilibacter marinus]
MKKILLVLYILFISISSYAQDFGGVHTSNFLPLQNIANDPTGIVRDSTKWNINVLSGQVLFLNDGQSQETDVFQKLANTGILSLDKLLGSTSNITVANGKIIFPSISYKFNHKNAIAVHFDLRGNGVYRASHESVAKLFKDVESPDGLDDLQNENLNGIVNTWTEYNVTYSRLLFENDKHEFAGGVTLKYLQGGGAGYFNMDGIDVSYDKTQINNLDFDLSYAVNETLYEITEDGKVKFNGDSGLGANIGFSYIYKDPNQKDKPYLFKAGLTINDIGSIKHSNNKGNKTYHVSMQDVPYSRFQGVETLGALIDTLKNSVDFKEIDGDDYSLSLPTTYAINADYCYSKNIYINASFSYQPSVYGKVIKSFKTKSVTTYLTPRFENKTWGFYLPMRYHNKLGANAGFGARWKGFYIGSATVIGNLFKSDSESSQFYFGVNIPIGKTI